MTPEFGTVHPLRPHGKGESPSAAPSAARPGVSPLPPGYDWKREYREGLPYWQHNDPVPPPPDQEPVVETPGDALNERQEAFCRAYVELPVGIKAARAAGYAPAAARRQATRLLKHPLVIRRIYELRDVRGKDYQVRRDTIIDQAEAVFEAAMEKADFYAAMQALTMKARLAGFADYLPGVRILRRDPRDYEQEFWVRTHARSSGSRPCAMAISPAPRRWMPPRRKRKLRAARSAPSRRSIITRRGKWQSASAAPANAAAPERPRPCRFHAPGNARRCPRMSTNDYE
jgi:hypothetical protein